ncbi:hypothetical protein Rhe02_54660 [Rhizocola hellebori]|uniref:Uncharacterized protein n=1 Tax=Rhizocola hellebori TaxID=1392758 RepID=A0A8J3QCQ4_9ACTN|nr:hypothetical protein [Rhizocola hellebori]GIH07399.1 hypothetical protein Rhe02_54660 [Rhizocola hellebori]
MADIKPTLDAIDEAIEGYVTWHGSGDAMVEVNGERGGFDGHISTWVDDAHAWAGEVAHERVTRMRLGQPRHVSIGGVDVTEYVRSVDIAAEARPVGLISASAPPEGEPLDAYEALRRFARIMDYDWPSAQPEQTVVAGPDVAARIEGLGIPVIESPLVPEGQVYVINQPTIGPMFTEPVSYSFDQDVATYRYGMRCLQPFSLTYRGVFDAADPIVDEVARIFDIPPHLLGRPRARRKQLHRAYRQRSLARRRRNR